MSRTFHSISCARYVPRPTLEKNPDKRVQQAIQLVFTKFAEFHSARQVHIWLRDEGIELPAKSRQGEAHGVVWRLPAYNIVHNILTNPIYAGAYAFGRTTSRVRIASAMIERAELPVQRNRTLKIFSAMTISRMQEQCCPESLRNAVQRVLCERCCFRRQRDVA